MIKIAICEDEKLFRDLHVRLMKDYLEEKALQYALDVYKKGEQLLEVNHKQYDILCLDIEIKNGIDGITLAKKLRIEGNESQIIFLTSHQEEAYKAFEVNAFRYLLKPLQKEFVVDCTMGDIENQLKDRHFFRTHKSFLINLEYIKAHNVSLFLKK